MLSNLPNNFIYFIQNFPQALEKLKKANNKTHQIIVINIIQVVFIIEDLLNQNKNLLKFNFNEFLFFMEKLMNFLNEIDLLYMTYPRIKTKHLNFFSAEDIWKKIEKRDGLFKKI